LKIPSPETVQLTAKVVGGTGVTAWLATANTALAFVAGALTICVLIQTLWKNRKK